MSFFNHIVSTSFSGIFKIKILGKEVWNYFAGGLTTIFAIFFFFYNYSEGDKTDDKIIKSIIYGIFFYLALLFILLIISSYKCLKNKLYHLYFEEKINEIENNYKTVIAKEKESFNNRFSTSINLLNKIFIKIHNFKKKYNSVDQINFNEDELNKDFIECLLFLCINLKALFENNDLNKDKIYSISIKFPIISNDFLQSKVNETSILKTICRDPQSKSRETDFYNKTKHTILGNTAFTRSLYQTMNRQKLQYYVNNDILNSDNYFNTSTINNDSKSLDYKSELVFPLINIENEEYDCFGFICCDCNEINGFIHQYQKDIISGICDGLYDFISLKHKISNIIKKTKNSQTHKYGNNRRNSGNKD